MKFIINFLIIITISFSLLKAKDTLIIGMELAYPPFEMTDKKGNPTGISVDLAKSLGKYLNKKVKIKNIAWEGLIPSLKTSKIDLIISSMTITKERQKTIDFSIPYAKSYLAILANKKSNIKSIDDLNKKNIKIAVKRGTTGHIYAKKYLNKAKILIFDKENTCSLEVIQGKADAFLYDQLTIFKTWEKNKAKTKALLKPFSKDFEYWGIAIQQGNDKLRKQVNEFIKEAKKNGTFNKLAHKYLKEAKIEFEKLNIPFFF